MMDLTFGQREFIWLSYVLEGINTVQMIVQMIRNLLIMKK